VILLIDIGNTRIKWATLDHDLSPPRAATYTSWNRADADAELFGTLTRPERILIANVGGDTIGQAVAEASQARWGLKPEFLHASKHAGGVRSGYKTPSQLGVDRWLALIAAHHELRRAACIASVGTAMTIDGVDASGLHVGGVIVPGPDLAKQSLLTNTSDLAFRSRTGAANDSVFADNTLGAIEQGVVNMSAALIERFLADMQIQIGQPVSLLLTGGASERVATALRVPFQAVSDLVLRGLAVIARS